ncbi:MAG: hypothetical protein SWO11_16610 [Thermodesulfobacteriota bacterium]|nr:hypothetical protein [Thermodesulfobacteriota bacterium]
MKNPFEIFKDYQPLRRNIPLDRIIESKDKVMDQIIAGYEKVVEEEVKSLIWVVERNRLAEAYSRAEGVIADMNYNAEDIEEFCYELDLNEKLPYLITGPSGIYISALCNYAKEDEITLNLSEVHRKIHLIGYRLPAEKKLIVYGNIGNFAGARLEGGELIIKGSVGDWAGSGMRRGKITIEKYAGYHTAEWMMDGEIWVDGRIRSMGKMINGRIYEMGKPIHPLYKNFSSLDSNP